MALSVTVRIERGQLNVDRVDLAKRIQREKDGEYELSISPTSLSDKRSDNANRYYWGCVLAEISRYTGDEPEDLHDIYTNLFARRKYLRLDRRTGEVHEIDLVTRTSRMKVSEFYRYVERVRQHAAEFHGVVTKDPDPEYRRYREAAFREAA